MARTRNIKPGFFKNDALAECHPLARILFAGLWTIADRDGRGEYRPKIIKAECLPYDDCAVDQLMAQLASHRLIRIYEVGGVKYFDIPTFATHQNPHPKEQSRNFPAIPCEIAASNLLATDKPLSSNCLAGPSPNHLVPSTSNPSQDHTAPEQAPVDGFADDAERADFVEATAPDPAKPAATAKRPRVAFTACDVEFPPELDTTDCRDAAERWLAHKRERGESYKSAKSFAMKLGELARAGPEAFVAAVKSSIGNNYAGIYSPKESKNASRNARPAYKPDPGLEYVPDEPTGGR